MIAGLTFSSKFAIDDLWIHFCQWLAFIMKEHLSSYSKNNFQFLYDELSFDISTGMGGFPMTQKDFDDDIKYNLREKIIEKYTWIINLSFLILSKMIWKEENIWKLVSIIKEGKIINYWMKNLETEKIDVYFGYKRPDFFGDSFEESDKKIVEKHNNS